MQKICLHAVQNDLIDMQKWRIVESCTRLGLWYRWSRWRFSIPRQLRVVASVFLVMYIVTAVASEASGTTVRTSGSATASKKSSRNDDLQMLQNEANGSPELTKEGLEKTGKEEGKHEQNNQLNSSIPPQIISTSPDTPHINNGSPAVEKNPVLSHSSAIYRRRRRKKTKALNSFDASPSSQDGVLIGLSKQTSEFGSFGRGMLSTVYDALTTYFSGGPAQAYKRLRLNLSRKLPWSWTHYLKNLPVINETAFPDFPVGWPHKAKKRLVMLLSNVSDKLANFLHLNADQRKHGIVVKAKLVTKGKRPDVILAELNAHMNIVPHSRFILPLISAYRGKSGKAVYLILPRLRATVFELLLREANTVNVKAALAEMAYAVQIMHNHGFLHRDLKLQNFFVGFDGHIKLADFEGVFDKTMWASANQDILLYSEGHLAPEIDFYADWVRYTEKSDVYALGICFRPFLTVAPKSYDRRLLKHLVSRMIAKDPRKRYTITEVLLHPFFKGIDFRQMENLSEGVPFPEGGTYENKKRFL